MVKEIQVINERLTLRASNLRIASRVHTQSGASRCILEQETLHTLLSICCLRIQKWVRVCFYKLEAFCTIELK